MLDEGQRIVTGGETGEISIWAREKQIWELEHDFAAHSKRVTSLAVTYTPEVYSASCGCTVV